MTTNSFGSRAQITVGNSKIGLYRLDSLVHAKIGDVETLPYSLRILLENLMRYEDGKTIAPNDVQAVASWNPAKRVDHVIDHSVQVDEYGTLTAFHHNVQKEFERNHERYLFLRWGQQAFANMKVVPPGTGICHQVNLEYLARVVWTHDGVAFPDS